MDNITVNTFTNQKGHADCVVAKAVDRLLYPKGVYCYPTDYGRKRCEAWDMTLPPICANEPHADEVPEHCKGALENRQREVCHEFQDVKWSAYPWCHEPWCYVDPENCDLPHSPSYYFPGRNLWYSYRACQSNNFFDIWGVPSLEMCQQFSVVEKPYYVMWFSCWACAFMQQVIDATRMLEENQDELSRGQKLYLWLQLLVLITETLANIQRIPWLSNDFWSNYNLYVYVFIHSSVFVRATMMSQIVWDWYEARLLKYPVIHKDLDGKGWTDEQRGILLIIIFQFGSSLGVFGIISITHIVPAFLCYYWLFLGLAAGVVQSRSWVQKLGVDPEGRFGRAMVMGVNSFISGMGIQLLVTSMVRVYAGQWKSGYLVPLKNDFWSRKIEIWYQCHLSRGIKNADQDFYNLFVR